MPDPLSAPGHTAAPPPAAAGNFSSEPGFAELGLNAALQQAAANAGWVGPTAVQRAVIPAVLQGRDLRVQAPTGAGKTAAFLLPLLQRLLQQPGVALERPRRLFALILAPTRELAAQTAATAQALAPQIKTVVAVGGLSINPQMMALRGGAHLLVATPGRLLDLTRQNALRLADLAVVVLDEADRLLDAGFAEETRRVLALLPRQRQTLLFSATLPIAVTQLAAAVQSHALAVTVLDDSPASPAPAAAAAHDELAGAAARAGSPLPDDLVHTAAAVAQRALVVDTALRTPLLRHLLATQGWRKVLVFVATQHASEHVADKLRQSGVTAAALHGQLGTGRRAEVLQDLKVGQLQVLVATDLAARGLDVSGLDAVVNHDLPRSAVDHTHRIGRTGRTGRAGVPGVAVSLVLADAPGSEAHFRLIEKRQQQRVPREVVPGFEPAAGLPAPLPADRSGGVKGKRLSKKDKLRAEAARG